MSSDKFDWLEFVCPDCDAFINVIAPLIPSWNDGKLQCACGGNLTLITRRPNE